MFITVITLYEDLVLYVRDPKINKVKSQSPAGVSGVITSQRKKERNVT